MNTQPRICIDPGVTKGHYCAIGRETIEAVEIHASVVTTTMHDAYALEAYVETPEINYNGKPDKDLLDLARASERAVAVWSAEASKGSFAWLSWPHYVPAQRWKAGDKNAHQFAVWQALTSAEQNVLLKLAPRLTRDKVVETLSRRCVNGTKSEYAFGNAIDAAGIFLYTGGRIDKFGRSA